MSDDERSAGTGSEGPYVPDGPFRAELAAVAVASVAAGGAVGALLVPEGGGPGRQTLAAIAIGAAVAGAAFLVLDRLVRTRRRRLAEALGQQRELLAENVRSLERTNRALTEARDELVHAEKLASTGRLAAGLAHEIGNPLNAILSYVEVGRRRGVEEEWLEGVREEAERIDEIVTGLLDFARPGREEPAPVAVGELLRDTLALLESQGRLDAIEVDLRVDEPLPPALARRGRLQQVLVNLLLNACDAVEESDAAGARVAVRASRGAFESPELPRPAPRREEDPEAVDYSHLRRLDQPVRERAAPPLQGGETVVRIAVADDGPGVEADPPRRVFEPFYTTKEPGRGTGLGLAVSERLIEGMGGWIEVRNREEGGAEFTICLPAGGGEEGVA